ncbi:MAG: PD40 domain-containing protein [Phycisphaeraceae bacterium]|nr:PD40 domain-containing protein [Phycisphaeraceae bacterium]
MIKATVAVLVVSAAGAAQAQFSCQYAPANWSYVTPGNSYVDTSDAPDSVTVVGNDDNSGAFAETDMTITVLVGGAWEFDWSYDSNDEADWDSGWYLLNGVPFFLAQNDSDIKSGSVSIPVSAGDVIGFRVQSGDSGFGPGYLTISRFSAPDPGMVTSRVSISSGGEQGNGMSFLPSVSADGRFVAFTSHATNLAPGANGQPQVYVRDRQTGSTSLVSVSSTGEVGNAESRQPNISADGRIVAFWSFASNLVPGDTNNDSDIFVHDRLTGQTTLVNISSTGEYGNAGAGGTPGLSADGRFVAFRSDATNLVPGDTNGVRDIFVHDRQTGQTTLVSVSSSGEQANGASVWGQLSGDGRFVVYRSDATNLVPGDTNGASDIFLHDRQTGQTTRVSVSSSGEQANGGSFFPWISSDGTVVVFESDATNLVPGDTNGVRDIFVHDRQTGQTTRVNVSSFGEQAAGDTSNSASVSADGRLVVFDTRAGNLVPGDTNDARDVFVHDRQTGRTTRVSVSSSGEQGNAPSGVPWISADGRHIAFDSFADNLVEGDTNEHGDLFVHQLGECEPPCYADCNGDGNVNTLDFLCYLNRYVAGDPAADCNGDTLVNTLDFVCFLNTWNAGCP